MNFHLPRWLYWLLGCGLLTCAAGAAMAGQTGALPRDLPRDVELGMLLRGVENKYNHLKTLRLHFQQIYRQGAQVIREEQGTLYLRKPGQMRWDYENPEPKLFLTNGKRLTLFVPEEKRVTETELKSSDDLRSPMRFLLGGLHFEKEFEQIQRSPGIAPLDTDDVVIQAVPKQMRDRLEQVVMEISPDYRLRRLILREPGGVQTEFRFGDQADDPPLSPELFRFRPPEGTEVVQQ